MAKQRLPGQLVLYRYQRSLLIVRINIVFKMKAG